MNPTKAIFYVTGVTFENSSVQLANITMRKKGKKDTEELKPIKEIYGINDDDCNIIFEINLTKEDEETILANKLEFALESFFSPHRLFNQDEKQTCNYPPFIKFIRNEIGENGGTFQPVSLASFLKKRSSNDFKKLDNKNIENFKTHVKRVMENKNDGLEIAMSRYNRIFKIRDGLDEILDYVIGFESIFGQTKEDGSIRYKLSMRISCLVSSDPTQRTKISTFMKKMYDIRSCIAHGSEASKKLRDFANEERVHSSIIILYLRQMLRESILVSLKLDNRDVNQIIDNTLRSCPAVE